MTLLMLADYFGGGMKAFFDDGLQKWFEAEFFLGAG